MSESRPEDFTRLHEAFDIDDPVFAERFEEVLDHLVAKCPVAHSSVGPGYHAFNRYRDVRRAAQDWRTFSSADGWMLNPPEGNIHILPEDLDPPYHTEWRRVLNPFFTAGAVVALESAARSYAGELIDRFVGRGHCEYVADFAAQLPGIILFRHILPVPVADLPVLFKDIDTYSFGPMDERTPAFGRVYAYLQRFLEARAAEPPRGDLVDVILAGVDCNGAPCSWSTSRSMWSSAALPPPRTRCPAPSSRWPAIRRYAPPCAPIRRAWTRPSKKRCDFMRRSWRWAARSAKRWKWAAYPSNPATGWR